MSAKRAELKRLAVFAAVADSGSFTAAAERLGSTKAMVSTQVRRLEAELGLPLFNRTTRRVSLTEEGRRLHQDSTPLLRQLEAVLDRAGAGGTLSGTLRITVSHDFVAGSFAPRLAAFALQHPQLLLDVVATDTVLDLVGEGIDLAIRGGTLRDSSLRAVQLARFEQWAVAAPDYLARHGLPRSPQDLAQHRWVSLGLLRSPLTWTFSGRNGARRTVRMKAAARCDAPSAVRELVSAGLGVSVLMDHMVSREVAQNRLVRLLPGWTLPQIGVHAVYPATRHVPAKVRALIDFLRQRREEP
jgi:DNA-binding transcriptional LysR family regulator